MCSEICLCFWCYISTGPFQLFQLEENIKQIVMLFFTILQEITTFELTLVHTAVKANDMYALHLDIFCANVHVMRLLCPILSS